ncbi:MAG: RsmB/NOP family class I SAM-dependent RNA methyltransferase [Pseudobdellovibrio sp.]
MSVNFQNEKFNAYFQSVYQDRWASLSLALTQPESQILRKNKYAQAELSDDFVEVFPGCYYSKSNANVHAQEDAKGVQVFYKMDPASYFVARALDVQENETVLDVCAAPGGKTLILAEALNGTGELVSNEYSNGRRERLLRVLRQYIPHDYRQNVFVTGKDGNQFGLQNAGKFDRILADVPCSGERHLIENSLEFAAWTKRRSENLAIRQYSLLSSAFLACKEGGRIVYSTCSISPLENDDVIKKLKKKRNVNVLEVDWVKDYSFIEKTEFGYCILPDGFGRGTPASSAVHGDNILNGVGYGPMYFSIIEK